MDKQRLAGALEGFFGEVSAILNAFRDRGFKRYGRAIIIPAFIAMSSDRLFYRSTVAELDKVEQKVSAAKASLKYADVYRELEASMTGLSANLAPSQNPDSWLLATLRDSMKSEGMVSESISPVNRVDSERFSFLSITVTCRANYKQLASWVYRLESYPKLVHVAKLEITKDSRDIGVNQVTATLSTAVPREGGSAP